MTDEEDVEIERKLKCPFCGHEAISRGIGAAYCGPHGDWPTVRMREVHDYYEQHESGEQKEAR